MYEMKYRDKNEMKESEIAWLGTVPENWDIVTLSRLFFIRAGGDLKTKFFNEVKSENHKYPIYTNNRNPDNVYGYTTKPFFNRNTITVTGRGDIGFACYRNVEYDAIIRLLVLTPKNNENCKFFEHFINGRLNFSVGSSAINQLSTQQIAPYKVFVPKLNEQQKIANFLDLKIAQFDNIIIKKEQLIKKLKEAKKSLISEVVTGKMKIVEGKLVERNASEMKDSGVEWLGMLPVDWITEKMKYIGKAIIGLTYSPDNVVDEKGTLVLRSSNVQNGKITFENNVYVDKKINPKLAVKEGDLLICSRNGSRKLIGKNALILKEHEGATFGAFMTIFRTKYSGFIHLVLNSTLFDYQAGSYLTSTVNQLTISNLNNMVVPFPTIREQEEIQEYLSRKLDLLTKTIDLIVVQIKKLKQAKQSLISEAVTGKIDLRDWEIIEEGELQ